MDLIQRNYYILLKFITRDYYYNLFYIEEICLIVTQGKQRNDSVPVKQILSSIQLMGESTINTTRISDFTAFTFETSEQIVLVCVCLFVLKSNSNKKHVRSFV